MIFPDVQHRVDQLAAHQVQGSFPVEGDIVERVRNDLGHPGEASLYVGDEEQMDRAEQQAADADDQP